MFGIVVLFQNDILFAVLDINNCWESALQDISIQSYKHKLALYYAIFSFDNPFVIYIYT
jgi:hypothetical protein